MAVDKNAYGCVDEDQSFVKRHYDELIDGEYYVVDLNNIVEKGISNHGLGYGYTSIDSTSDLDLIAKYAIYNKGVMHGAGCKNAYIDFCIDPENTPLAEEGAIILQYNKDNHCFIDPVTGVAFEENEDYQTSDYSALNYQNFMEAFDRAKKVPFYYTEDVEPEVAKMSDKINEELSQRLEVRANACRNKLDRQFEKMVQAQYIIACYEQEFEDVQESESKTK